ncbi:MAG: hypothetical protein FD180_1570 [Planctomycetota bacterium]|nr:MAG: hypothetical protein FD180_1570 [Planctomycetota bacterium]
MKRIPWILVAAWVAGCGGDAPPKSREEEAAFEIYRSDCAAARLACERAADSAGMEKGTRGLGAFLEQWAANPKLKPPADAAERGAALSERFAELDATLRSVRAIADGSGEDENTLQAIDHTQKAVKNMAALVRDLASGAEKDIVEFATRDRQNELAQRLLASAQDVRETTIPTCENAARALVSARESLKRARATK